MSMTSRAKDLVDGIKGLADKFIKKEMDLRSIANMDSEDLRLIKETYDLMEQSCGFTIDEIEMIEKTHDELLIIKRKLDEQDRKLDRILSKLQEEKKVKD